MRKFLPLVVISVILIAGCITFEEEGPTCIDPEKSIDRRCCFDEDDNGVCDIDEKECPESCNDDNPCTRDYCSLQTNFECKHTGTKPCCGNGECEESEDLANECPEDCEIIGMTGFYHRYSGPDYMDGDTFVFIHTGSNETDKKPDFHLNITAGGTRFRNIRATYNCTDSETGHKIDSIDSDRVEVLEGYPEIGYENKLESSDYIIYTSFFSLVSKKRLIDIDELEPGKTAEFRIRITKNQYKVRSDLTCDFDFYFLDPLKHVRKELKISYI
jgi:hypothetical protein